jgi:hypothetical protein
VAIDPVFEGGRWGARARAWNVENELIAVAILGDVTIDLSETSSAPAKISIDAYTFIRDVVVLVADGTHVEIDGAGVLGGVLHGTVSCDVPAVPEAVRGQVVRLHGRPMFGDISVCLAAGHRHEERGDLPGLWAKLTRRWNSAISNRRIGVQVRSAEPGLSPSRRGNATPPGLSSDVPEPQGYFWKLPYDLRRPTRARFCARWWNRNDPRLLTPRSFGWGYAINFYWMFNSRPNHE